MISAFIDKRLKGGLFGVRKLAAASERTVNPDLMALRNVLKAAIDDGFLRELPRFKMLEQPPSPKRQFLLPSEFDRLLNVARGACQKMENNLPTICAFSRLVAPASKRRCALDGRM
jgi:hypothetical protein